MRRKGSLGRVRFSPLGVGSVSVPSQNNCSVSFSDRFAMVGGAVAIAAGAKRLSQRSLWLCSSHIWLTSLN